MRKDAQLGKLLVKVPRHTRRVLPAAQYLGHNVVPLPLAPPRRARRRDGQLRVQLQVLDINALEPGQRGIPRSRLQAQPALVLEADLAQLLSTLHGQIVQPFRHLRLRLVQWRVPVLVGQRDEGAVVHQLLSDRRTAPEGGVVQRSVAVLVGRVHVAALLQQHHHDVVVVVGAGQVQRNVVAHVRSIDTSAPLQQHLHEFGVALLGAPVQRTEAVVVAGRAGIGFILN